MPWIHDAPKSKGASFQCVLVQMRPPMRWRASNTVTSCPACLSFLAAARPERPAPTTMIFFLLLVLAINLDGFTLAASAASNLKKLRRFIFNRNKVYCLNDQSDREEALLSKVSNSTDYSRLYYDFIMNEPSIITLPALGSQ